jgi:hypothetical protein
MIAIKDQELHKNINPNTNLNRLNSIWKCSKIKLPMTLREFNETINEPDIDTVMDRYYYVTIEIGTPVFYYYAILFVEKIPIYELERGYELEYLIQCSYFNQNMRINTIR